MQHHGGHVGHHAGHGVTGVAPRLGEHVHAGQKPRARVLQGVERLLGGMELAPCGVHVLAQLRQLLVRVVVRLDNLLIALVHEGLALLA